MAWGRRNKTERRLKEEFQAGKMVLGCWPFANLSFKKLIPVPVMLRNSTPALHFLQMQYSCFPCCLC